MMRIRVIGSGIIGLAVAQRLAKSGHAVEIVSAVPPERTTSAVAGALWYPYRAMPEHLVTRWSARSYETLTKLSVTEPAAGVRLRSGRELFTHPAPEPWWRSAVPDFGRTPGERLPAGYVDGYELTVPIVDMEVHLDWLRRALEPLNVEFQIRRIDSLHQAVAGVDAVVNCTGLGSRQLADDTTMRPVRGQAVVVEQFGQLEWVVDQSDPVRPTVVIPRENVVILGGTADDGVESLDVNPDTTRLILARCAALVPQIAQARVLRSLVGIRPTRPAVRLDKEDVDGCPVVHCYGHGGAGVTLAYGCAEDVAEQVSSL